jgi:four helix bundle protein
MKDEGGERPEDLRGRTRRFALMVIVLSTRLPRGDEVNVMRRQLLRSATSVAAHYREAYRARSNAEFISKMKAHCRNLMSHGYGANC